MALIQCWECGGQVSDQAVACPRCGAPQRPVEVARRSGWRWLRRALVILGLAAVAVVIARRQGWIDDELILRARAGMPASWGSELCQPLQRFGKVAEYTT